MIKWILIILALLGLDQLSKALVVSNMIYGEAGSIPIIEDFFHFTYTLNDGAGLGLLEGLADKNYLVFIILIAIALVIFSAMFIKTDFKNKENFWYILGLTFLIAGAIGNGLDRVFQVDHYVVDFIDFRGIWPYIFNVADICLNVGIAIFIIDQFFLEPKRKKMNG